MTLKTASAAFITHLGQEETTTTLCWKLVPAAPLPSLRFTTIDVDLPGIDIGDGAGAETYDAETGFIREALRYREEMAVDSASAQGVFDSLGIDEDDLLDRYYDGAALYLFLVNYEDLSQGIIKMKKGWLGEVSAGGLTFTAEMRDLFQLLQQDIGNFYGEGCRVLAFGDSECTVDRDPAAWAATTAYVLGDRVVPASHDGRFYVVTTAGTSGGSEPSFDTTIGNTTADGSVVWTAENSLYKIGTVDVVTSNQVFTLTGLTTPYPDDIYSEGVLKFTDNLNISKQMDVESWVTATLTVTLREPMPRAVVSGDAIRFEAGCDRSFDFCFNKFDNLRQRRAEDYLPNDNAVFAYARPN